MFFLFKPSFQKILLKLNINEDNKQRFLKNNPKLKIVDYFNLHTKQGSNNLEKIINLIHSDNTKVICKFKCLMLLHYLVATQSQKVYYDYIIQKKINLEQKAENISVSTTKFEVDKQLILENNLIIYYNFIKKLCMNGILYNECKSKLKNFRLDVVFDKIFRLINILKYSVKLKKVIQYFGKNHFQEYPFLIDFNILLITDVKSIFNYLNLLINETTTIKRTLMKNQLAMLVNSVEETNNLKTDMDFMFYNKYYYQYNQNETPETIDLLVKQKEFESLVNVLKIQENSSQD